MTVVATAIFYPLPGKKQELVAAMRAGIEAVHTEQGCDLYAIHDAADGTVTMIEKWASVADLDAHGSSAEVEVLREAVKDLVEKPALVTRMTPIPMGTEEQGQL